MMRDFKTVDVCDQELEIPDPLSAMKREGVARMKAALLACSLDDPYSAQSAIQQVTIMRVYHQVTRIVQYLDLMDKLEDRMYKEIEYQIDHIPDMYDDPASNQSAHLSQLLAIQERLQKSIIESNKLLQPYLEMNHYEAFTSVQAENVEVVNNLGISASDRKSIREDAGNILRDLQLLSSSDAVEA